MAISIELEARVRFHSISLSAGTERLTESQVITGLSDFGLSEDEISQLCIHLPPPPVALTACHRTVLMCAVQVTSQSFVAASMDAASTRRAPVSEPHESRKEYGHQSPKRSVMVTADGMNLVGSGFYNGIVHNVHVQHYLTMLLEFDDDYDDNDLE